MLQGAHLLLLLTQHLLLLVLKLAAAELGLVGAAIRGGVCRRPAAAGPKALSVGLGQ